MYTVRYQRAQTLQQIAQSLSVFRQRLPISTLITEFTHLTSDIFTPRALHSECSERGVYEISVRSMHIDDRRPTRNRPQGTFTLLGKFQMATTLQSVIRSTSCMVLGRGFRPGRIERR